MLVSVMVLVPFFVNYFFRIGDALLPREGRRQEGLRVCDLVGGFLVSVAA